MVEADLDGGVVAVRYGLGREPGLTTFAAAGPMRARRVASTRAGRRRHPGAGRPDAPGASTSIVADRWGADHAQARRRRREASSMRPAAPLTGADRCRLRCPGRAGPNPVAEELVALTHACADTAPGGPRGGSAWCSSVTAPTGWATSSRLARRSPVMASLPERPHDAADAPRRRNHVPSGSFPLAVRSVPSAAS
jgi:hypothetical protein